MPLNYFLNARIQAIFDFQNIKNILKKGEKIGITFFKERENIFDKSIDLNSAINKLLNEDKLYEFNSIDLKIDDDTYTTLYCDQLEKGELEVSFFGMFKPKEDDLELFLAQFAKVLLLITSDYQIKNITIKYEDILQEDLNENEYKFYSFLNIKKNANNIYQILNNGIKSGIKYFNIPSLEKLSEEILNNLNKKIPSKIKFECNGEIGFLVIEVPTLDYSTLSDEDLALMLQIEEYRKKVKYKSEKMHIFLRFLNLKECWKKKFIDGTEGLDLAKYADLMLSLTDGLELEEFQAGKL